MARVASLREFLPGPMDASTKVCLVTYELDGPTIPSEIGTFFLNHARMLAWANHKVTVFLLREKPVRGEAEEWVKRFSGEGIELVFLPPTTLKVEFRNASELTTSYRVLEWLESREFEVIHFHEWRAPAYYFMLARNQGIFPYECRAFVTVHHPHRWLEMTNWRYIDRPYHVEVNFMERKAVEKADAVVSLTESMHQWMKNAGWKTPVGRTYVWPGWTGGARTAPSPGKEAARHERELIFINYGDVSGGIRLLCAAVEELAKSGDCDFKVRILFLGTEGRLGGLKALVDELCGEWPEKPEIEQIEELEDLKEHTAGRGRIVLFSSGGHHFGAALELCLEAGAKVLVNNSCPMADLIAVADRKKVTFAPRPPVLAQRVRELWENDEAEPLRFAEEQEGVKEHWLRWYAGAPIEQNPVGNLRPGVQPRVTICMPHFNRPDLLRQAIDSLESQTYRNFQLILVDDGSTQPEAVELLERLEPLLAESGWRLLRQKNQGPAAARNWAAQEADGDYLLFMDDDNIAKPEELECLVRAALTSGAEVLCPLIQAFGGNGVPTSDDDTVWVWLPLGPCAAMGAMSNCFGDTNFLVRTDVFKKLGGFTADLAHGQIEEDWDILSRAVLAGFEVQIIPRMLFWYRRNEDEGAARSVSGPRYVKDFAGTLPYREDVNPDLHDVFLIANALVKGPKTGPVNDKRARKLLRRQARMLQKLMKQMDSIVKAGRRMENSSRWKLANPVRVLHARFRGGTHTNGNGVPIAGYEPFEKAVARYETLREEAEQLLEEIKS